MAPMKIGEKRLQFFRPSAAFRELVLLYGIHQQSKTTQSQLAKMAGIVPAMVNNYIKDFVKAGHVAIRGRTNRDMTYHLTEAGQARLSELFRRYLNETVGLYIHAKDQIRRQLQSVYDEGFRRVVFYGAAETGEIAVAVGHELGLVVAGIVDSDPRKHGKSINGLRVEAPEAIPALRPEVVVISSFGYQNQIRQRIGAISDRVEVRAI
jgi:DNA-binding MarR family transcriptional regulator